MSELDPWELGGWDAVETAERLRRREVSAREVVEAACARAEAVSTLNAMVTSTRERALEAASTAAGPLAGVPTLIKDLAQVAGVRTAWGSASCGNFVSTRSTSIVRAFDGAGLVSIGKSATPEFGLTATTEPLAFGPCRNPWGLEHSTGGSSGGAAALVAAGVVPLAHASDGGGSIRIPAACCGLVGLKPTRGRLDMEGSSLLPVNIAVDGVVSRTVRDTVAFFAAVERPSRGGLPPIGAVAPAPARRLRLAVFVESPTGVPVDPEVRAAVEQAASLCSSLGHDVRPIPCPFDGQAVDDFARLWAFVAWSQATFGKALTHRGYDSARVEPFTSGFARAFASRRAASLQGILRLRGFSRTYASIVRPYDALIGPTLAAPPPLLGYLSTDVPFETAFARLLAYTPFTGLINAAGAPAISLPLGRSASGLPIGVHFAAAHGADRLLLELATELESAGPWARTAPRARRAQA